MKNFLSLLSLLAFLNSGYAQEETKEEFKPTGKPFIKVFTNFNSTTTDGKTHNAFDVTRAYLGYAYNLSENLSGNVTLDVGSTTDGKPTQLTAYLKTAFIQYKSDKLTAKFGLIGLEQFSLQEKLWNGRYLYKSFQDQYKFGSTADLGLNLMYKLHDMVSVDLTIANGEGYKKLETDSIFKYSVGLTLTPLNGLTFRTYYDYMGRDDSQQTLSIYAGYSNEKINFGAEYNQQMGYKITPEEDWNGFSVYASYKLEKARLFARFDQLSSVTLAGDVDPWNYSGDGQAIIVGAEFSPVKGLKITPNYQGWIPADESAVTHGAYLSCEISF